MEPELCPFCGKDALFNDQDGKGEQFWISCGACGMGGPMADSITGAWDMLLDPLRAARESCQQLAELKAKIASLLSWDNAYKVFNADFNKNWSFMKHPESYHYYNCASQCVRWFVEETMRTLEEKVLSTGDNL